MSYSVQAGSSVNLSPVDSMTYYYGCFPGFSPLTVGALARCYVPKSGTIKAVYGTFRNAGILGSAQSSTLSVYVNNSSDNIISTAILNNQAVTTFNNSSLSIAVSAGDYFEIKWVTPVWTKNPTNVRVSVIVFIE